MPQSDYSKSYSGYTPTMGVGNMSWTPLNNWMNKAMTNFGKFSLAMTPYSEMSNVYKDWKKGDWGGVGSNALGTALYFTPGIGIFNKTRKAQKLLNLGVRTQKQQQVLEAIPKKIKTYEQGLVAGFPISGIYKTLTGGEQPQATPTPQLRYGQYGESLVPGTAPYNASKQTVSPTTQASQTVTAFNDYENNAWLQNYNKMNNTNYKTFQDALNAQNQMDFIINYLGLDKNLLTAAERESLARDKAGAGSVLSQARNEGRLGTSNALANQTLGLTKNAQEYSGNLQDYLNTATDIGVPTSSPAVIGGLQQYLGTTKDLSNLNTITNTANKIQEYINAEQQAANAYNTSLGGITDTGRGYQVANLQKIAQIADQISGGDPVAYNNIMSLFMKQMASRGGY